MYSHNCKLISLLSLLAIFGFAMPKASQAAIAPLAVRSVGMVDSDGSVLYSVVLASGPDSLKHLTVTASVPDNTQFIEIVSQPARITGQTDGKTLKTVNWQVDSLNAATLLGPFIYRVKFTGQDGEPPANVSAKVSWTQPTTGTAEAALISGGIEPLAPFGTITFDAKGTLNAHGQNNAVPVGDSGILIYVPPEAVSKTTRLSFTRLTIEDKSIPTDVKYTWWCALVSVGSDAAVDFSKPISLVLSTRRSLTPGLMASIFTRSGNGKWQRPNESSLAFIGPDASNAGIVIDHLIVQAGSATQIALGVDQSKLQQGTVNAAALPPNPIKDGTSNGAIP
jgi:hypothetical protein